MVDAMYHEYGALVYRFALRLTRDRNDAEDLTMDAFVSLYRSIDQIREPGAAKTWLYRAALNRWNRLRRKARTESLDRDVAEVFGLSVSDRLALWQAMDTLPEKLRVAVWLVKGEGLTHREAAEVLRVPTGTVQDRVFRAVQRLRKELTPVDQACGALNPRQSEVNP